MKRLHYPLLILVLFAVVALPSWYALRGSFAEGVPGDGGREVLRSNSARTYVGGGPRNGK